MFSVRCSVFTFLERAQDVPVHADNAAGLTVEPGDRLFRLEFERINQFTEFGGRIHANMRIRGVGALTGS
jgi:hypothetical protein